MYRRRRRRRQRSLTPVFSFCEGASSVSTADTSPVVDVDDIKNDYPHISPEKFLFAKINSVDEKQSAQCKSINSDTVPCLPLNIIAGKMSMYTPYGTETVSLPGTWVKPAARKRRRSLCFVPGGTDFFSKNAHITEELPRNGSNINSLEKEQLLNSLAGNALLKNGENSKYTLENCSNNKEIVRWELLDDYIEKSKKNAHAASNQGQVSASPICPRKSFDLDHLYETARIPGSPSKKRVLSHSISYDNLLESIVKDEVKRSTPTVSRKYTDSTTKLEADESGVLKKRFEVEKIVDHCTSKNKRYYYVKWKGWDSSDNTWEPEEHLKTCKEALKDYLQFLRQRVLSGNLFVSHTAKSMQEELVVISRSELEKIMKSYVKTNGVPYTVCSEEEIIHKMRIILRSMKVRKGEKSTEKVKNDILIRVYDIHRWVQIDALQAWEKELNTKAIEKAKILVENNVDLEAPPLNFTYVNDYIPGKDVIIPDEPPIGCMCGSKCDRRSKECCGMQSGSIFAYSSKRLLMASVGVPIYECNKRCKCDENCFNRVVQRGRKVDLSIFRTSTGCGWGVKTLQHIKNGAFICEYVGEVITTKEAERRGKIYDAEGRTYLFDLDFNVDACPYTVDAAVYGNISHFINHSCNPNVAVFAVWINCLDPNLPKLALFANKDIKAGEELTFDYMRNNLSIQSDMTDLSNQVTSSPRSRLLLPDLQGSADLTLSKTRCKCGAEQCKRYLF